MLLKSPLLFAVASCLCRYGDFRAMASLLEGLVATLATEVCGSTQIEYQGRELQLGAPWRRETMASLVLAQTGLDFHAPEMRERGHAAHVAAKHVASCGSAAALPEGAAATLGDIERASSAGGVMMALFEVCQAGDGPRAQDPSQAVPFPFCTRGTISAVPTGVSCVVCRVPVAGRGRWSKVSGSRPS